MLSRQWDKKMTANRKTDEYTGFDRSDATACTIANGQTEVTVDADLLRNYAYLLITCADCSNIAASTSLLAKVGYDATDEFFDLYERDDPGTQWSKGDLPTTGTLAFALIHALGAQRLRLVLSQAASGGDVVFKVYAIAASVKHSTE